MNTLSNAFQAISIRADQLQPSIQPLVMTRSCNKRSQLARAAAPKSLVLAAQHKLERELGHIFSDPTILQEALQGAGNGATQLGEPKIKDGN